MPGRAGESSTGYALRVFPRANNKHSRRSQNQPWTYTYPQLTIMRSAPIPGSILDWQGGSNLDWRQHT